MIIRLLFKFLSFIYNFLIELVFPPRCVICDELYVKKSFFEEEYVCDRCRKKLRFVKNFSNNCKKCSRSIASESIICPACQVIRYKYDIALSCVIYEKSMRASLLSYKFSEQRYKYRTFAKIMVSNLKNFPYIPNLDVIVSVPVSKKRKKSRGFDHVKPIAKYISKALDVPYKSGALIKIKDTPPQSRLSFNERFLSVKGAFKIDKDISFKGKSILLIDDIYTTGATVSEISGLLKRSGAKFVAVLTLCITPNIQR